MDNQRQIIRSDCCEKYDSRQSWRRDRCPGRRKPRESSVCRRSCTTFARRIAGPLHWSYTHAQIDGLAASTYHRENAPDLVVIRRSQPHRATSSPPS